MTVKRNGKPFPVEEGQVKCYILKRERERVLEENEPTKFRFVACKLVPPFTAFEKVYFEFQDFRKDRRVDLPNMPIDEIIIIIKRKNRNNPMRVTVELYGCIHPSKYELFLRITNRLDYIFGH